MLARTERRSFVAHDVDGNKYVLVAVRSEVQMSVTKKSGWTYQTMDGRVVRRERGCHMYTIEMGDVRLITSDLAEPLG